MVRTTKRLMMRPSALSLSSWTMRALLCAVLLVACVSRSHAGLSSWTSGGPYGGLVVSMAVDQTTTPSTIYAVTSQACKSAWGPNRDRR